jgi:hypothetical protein
MKVKYLKGKSMEEWLRLWRKVLKEVQLSRKL